MKEYKRLTIRLANKEIGCLREYRKDDLIRRLAELEDKIENGTLVPKYSIVDCGGTYCVCTVDTDNLLVIGEYDTEEEAKQRLEEIRNKNEN